MLAKISETVEFLDMLTNNNLQAKNSAEAERLASKPIKCQVLTDAMKKKQYEWALEYQHWTLDMLRSVG